MPDAPVIRGDDPASFAHSVFAERHPALIRKVQDATPYGPEQRRALDELLRNTLHGTVEPPAEDKWWDTWNARRHAGRSWFSLPFLAAESCFYRQLLCAVGYFGPGPWQGVDPFRPFKLAELDTPEAAAELAALGPCPTSPSRTSSRPSSTAPSGATGRTWGSASRRPRRPAPPRRPHWSRTTVGRCCRC